MLRIFDFALSVQSGSAMGDAWRRHYEGYEGLVHVLKLPRWERQRRGRRGGRGFDGLVIRFAGCADCEMSR